VENPSRREDALALLRTGYMPLEPDEADRLRNHAEKYDLKPWALLKPLRRGTEAEKEALEPIREQGYAKGIDPGYETVLCYGIAFYRKTALVKEWREPEKDN
jgi:hypothetical protein